jgi:hypothetical protein
MGAPISPVVSGLLEAYSIANLVKRNALAEREIALREQNSRQDQIMRDIEMQVKLPQVSRPVSDAGTIDTQVGLPVAENAPAQLHRAQEIGLIPSETTLTRKADRSRTIKYGEREYELMTPEEQEEREARRLLNREKLLGPGQRRNAAALKRAEQLAIKGADLDAEAARRAAFGIDVPDPTGEGTIGGVLPSEASAFLVNRQPTLMQEYLYAKKNEGFQGNMLQFAQQRNLREPAPVLSLQTNEETGVTTPVALKLGAGGVPVTTTGATLKDVRKGRPSRADGAPSESQVFTREQRAQKLHAERQELGRQYNLKDNEKFLDNGTERRMNPLYRARARKRHREATEELRAIEKSLGRSMTEFEPEAQGATPAAPAAQQAAPAAPKLSPSGQDWVKKNMF